MDGPEVIEENQLRELQDFRYYSPKFEADEYNPGLLRYLPWAGHRAFAYDYVRNERPSCIVELGSYYGCSAFAFLQAMKDGGIAGSFYAVDTWEGDSFTKNDYREDIYGQYKEIQDTCFSDWDFSFEKDSSGKDLHKRDTISDKDLHKGDTTSDKGAHMLRMTFDEAVRLFEDDSIDLLHIDGSHLYEDVKHDFLTWKNKVAFIYDAKTLDYKQTYSYAREGWGLTTDGKSLIASDGTSRLYWLDEQFKQQKALTVKMNGRPVNQLNELEWIDGKVWANVYMTDMIVIINPQSGEVEATVDCTGLLPRHLRDQYTDVLNGIAYNPATKKVYLTGKYWKRLYEVELVEKK